MGIDGTVRPSGAVSTTANAASGRREMRARDHSSAIAGAVSASTASTKRDIIAVTSVKEYSRLIVGGDNAQREIRSRR